MESAKSPRSSMLETKVARFINRVVMLLSKVSLALQKDSSTPSVSFLSLSCHRSEEGPGMGSATAIASFLQGSKSGYLSSKVPKRSGQSN